MSLRAFSHRHCERFLAVIASEAKQSLLYLACGFTAGSSNKLQASSIEHRSCHSERSEESHHPPLTN
jgi:hypothetical protein